MIKLLSLPDALSSARPRTEVRPEEGITVPVLVVTDPATTLVNRFCRQLHQAYRLRLATDPRVRLFEVASLAQLATVAHAQRPAVIVNLSRHPVAARAMPGPTRLLFEQGRFRPESGLIEAWFD